MAKQYDATLKHLVESRPLDWLDLAGLPHGAAARLVDADLSAVTAAADKVVLVEGESPYIAHLEFQSGPDPDLDQRVMLYNVLLRWRHRVPVRSVVFLLGPKAIAARNGGRYTEQLGPAHSIDFAYRLLMPWLVEPDAFLSGGLGTLPLAALGAGEADVTAVVEKVDERLRAELPKAEADALLVATLTLAGLRHDRTVVARILSKVRNMEESSFYQLIVEKGEARGEARGELKGERRALLRLGRRRFGDPPADVLTAINSIEDAERLESLVDRVLDATGWDELLSASTRPSVS